MSRVPIRAYLGDQQLSRDAVRSSDYYERPKDWLVLPPAPEPQGVRALAAVFPGGNNFYSILAQNAYTVDWGDGTIRNYSSNGQANYTINYNNLSPSTECSRGYRQAIVTITPQAGQNLTYFQLVRPGTVVQPGLNSLFRAAWLDMNINLPFLPSGNRIVLGGQNTGNPYLERVYIKSWGDQTSLTNLLHNNSSLRSLNEHEWNMSKITNLVSTFRNCTNLVALDTTNWNLSAVTTMSTAFFGCSLLLYINGIENWNLSNVTFLDSTLSYLPSLRTTNDSGILDLSKWRVSSNCTTLETVFADSFKGQSNIKTLNVSGWNTSRVTNATRTFQTVGCEVLNLSSWNLSACPSMGGLFHGSTAHTIYTPILNLSSGPNIYDNTIGTTFYGFAFGCGDLQTIVFANSGINTRISFTNCQFSAPSLNYIFQNLSNDGAGKTITITGNWGISAVGYNPSIATNKGWTVIQ